jgi:hypothetical protein
MFGLACMLPLCVPATTGQPVAGLAERVEMAEGPCRAAWEASGGKLPAAAPPRSASFTGADGEEVSLDLSEGTWSTPGTWDAWTKAVDLARTEHGEDVQPARCWLARLALQQGRWEDAWSHFEHAGRAAELMSSFLPGVTGSIENGVLPDGALSDGALIRPAPPPPTAGLQPGYVDVREAWVRGLRVGDAVLDMRVAIEPEGVQIDLEHVSGGSARLVVQLPEPEGLELRVAYIDWMRQDELGPPLEVVVAPGDEPHSLYGRFLGRELEWPTGALERVPAAIDVGGLSLIAADDDPEHARLAAVCGALARYGCRVTPTPPLSGIAFHVPPPGPARERKLAWLVSAYESITLSAP